MASPDLNCFIGPFSVDVEDDSSSDGLAPHDLSPVSVCHQNHLSRIPKPPPPPRRICKWNCSPRRLIESSGVAEETKYIWEKLFEEGYMADVYVVTAEDTIIPAHSSVLKVVSPVLGNLLHQAEVKRGIGYIRILGVPHEAVWTFLRFLYSSCYDEEQMRKFVLHLLVLSHSYSVPSLKRICQQILEWGALTTENVIDVLQLARNCDAPRLSLICVRMITRDFRTISSTEGWRVMKRCNPTLEQELLEAVVEADSRKEERLRKAEENTTYYQLRQAMEALVHICNDGCGTIGPRDKALKGSQVVCSFPACKGLETLVRHLSSCEARVRGGCTHCKRMWQLLELHSGMCNDPGCCRVPLCRHFREKMRLRQRKDGIKWKMLVTKVMEAKNPTALFQRPDGVGLLAI